MENYTVFSTATPNSPALGTWKTNQKVIDSNGIIWQCTVPGSPGTWTQVGGNSGALTLISRQVLAAPVATVTFSSIPQTYENLVLTVTGRVSDAANDEPAVLQFNGDGAANYDWIMVFTSTVGGTVNTGATAATAANVGWLPGASSPANAAMPGSWTVRVVGYARTAFYKQVRGMGEWPQGGSGLWTVADTSGAWHSTAAITSLSLADGGGGSFIVGSTFSLYGES